MSGLELYAVEENAGHLASVSTKTATIPTTTSKQVVFVSEEEEEGDHEDEEFWEELHEVPEILMLALVILHVAGVALASVGHRENLVRAMVTGKKRARSG